MKRGYRNAACATNQRKMKVIKMKMQNVEFTCFAKGSFYQANMMSKRILNSRAVQPESPLCYRY